jgi:DnaK suppressor protein
MNAVDAKKYQTLLMAKRDEILTNSRRRDEIFVVQSNEQVEMVQLAGERDFAVFALERDAMVLAQIGAALERIEDGEFGVCVECEEPISSKRLVAVPWAACCIRCQESRDAHDATFLHDPRMAA